MKRQDAKTAKNTTAKTLKKISAVIVDSVLEIRQMGRKPHEARHQTLFQYLTPCLRALGVFAVQTSTTTPDAPTSHAIYCIPEFLKQL